MSVTLLIAVGIPVFAILALVVVLPRVIHVVEEGELLVVEGGLLSGGDGGDTPYRVVVGEGRAFAIPALASVTRMRVEPIEVDVRLEGAETEDGEAVDVEVDAVIRPATERPGVGQYYRRFSDTPVEGIARTGREVLEGNVEERVSELPASELEERRTELEEELRETIDEASREKLGLRVERLDLDVMRGSDRGSRSSQW